MSYSARKERLSDLDLASSNYLSSSSTSSAVPAGCTLHIENLDHCPNYYFERDQWEDQGVGGWTILKWILDRWDGVDWIDVAQDRDQWRALVNKVMNFRVP
jgi:hypothetical protein